MLNNIFEVLFVILGAYLIGSIPTGYIVVKLFTGKDIRQIGSGSTGATNVKRVMGKTWFFIVLLLDAFKGALPVILAKMFTIGLTSIGIMPVVAAVAVIVGHSKSIFLNFTGGKSVASSIGTIIALNWQVGLILAGIWAAVTFVSRYVSVGSIVALWLAPFVMLIFKQPIAYAWYCTIGAIYITYLHRGNIKRLLKGDESKVR
ncbi:MAG: glycerol-3-phosphate 1-O-acyltransferase PlsY [Clostridiaceae bacterium]|jgi:acyl phosphate:glycerol-3-phosphate acyltransferase|nr:glycerol-3-phosphate 1-O-acyltransferase PlsY [Clostridiaceae bacterium]